MSTNYQRWFFNGYYRVAGRPKMEEAIMARAIKEYNHCLVFETFLPKIVKDLCEYQDRALQENKRMKPCKISLSGLSKGEGDIAWIHIGEQHLALTRVKEEIEYM